VGRIPPRAEHYRRVFLFRSGTRHHLEISFAQRKVGRALPPMGLISSDVPGYEVGRVSITFRISCQPSSSSPAPWLGRVPVSAESPGRTVDSIVINVFTQVSTSAIESITGRSSCCGRRDRPCSSDGGSAASFRLQGLRSPTIAWSLLRTRAVRRIAQACCAACPLVAPQYPHGRRSAGRQIDLVFSSTARTRWLGIRMVLRQEPGTCPASTSSRRPR